MNEPNKPQVMSYVGFKVVLRPVNAETDLENCHRWINDESVNRFLANVSPITILQEREYLENAGKNGRDVVYAVEDKATGAHIGQVGLHNIHWPDRLATAGAVIGEKSHWKKGFGTDAIKLLMNHAFYRLNLRLIHATVISFNERSAGCLRKCGWKEEGIRKSVHYREGKYWDQLLFRIDRSDFEPIWNDYLTQLAASRNPYGCTGP